MIKWGNAMVQFAVAILVLAPRIFLGLFRCSFLYSRNTPNFNFDPGNSGRIASSRKCQSC